MSRRLLPAGLLLVIVVAGVVLRARTERGPAARAPTGAAASRPSYAPDPDRMPGTTAPAPDVTAAAATSPSAGSVARRARYGVNLSGGDPRQVRALGLEWFIPCCDPAFVPPEGTRMPQRIFFKDGRDEAALRARVRRWPGAYWLIDNEPNVPEMGNTSPEAYADALAWYARVIKDADPTARLVGPNVLNWSYTCDGCGGYTQGRAWTAAMRDAYLRRYGTEPPLDVWALHAYDVDWGALPQGDAARQIEQVRGLRDWLDAIPGQRGSPVWITEIGILWGYPAIAWQGDLARPAGAYDFDHVERYMRALFGWLNANAEPLHLERWFLWSVWEGAESWQTEPGGISLVAGPQPDAPITRLGRLYQELAGVR